MTLSTKIILCFIAALLTTIFVRFAIGERRELWFKRTSSTIFNQRGFIGQYLSLGYPITRQGLVVWLGLFAAIGLECLFFIYVIPDL